MIPVSIFAWLADIFLYSVLKLIDEKARMYSRPVSTESVKPPSSCDNAPVTRVESVRKTLIVAPGIPSPFFSVTVPVMVVCEKDIIPEERKRKNRRCLRKKFIVHFVL